ncbi:MAG: DUF4397 domain-containing protein, partial [Planctomycetota bacterium]
MLKSMLTGLSVAVVALSGLSSTARAEVAEATIVHGIPGAVVDIYVNDMLVAEAVEFTNTLGPVDLPANELVAIDIAAHPSGDADSDGMVDDPLLSAEVTLECDVSYTAVAHLTPGAEGCDSDAGIALSLFVNDVSRTSPGKARATVRHLADAPPVDIDLNRGKKRTRTVLTIEGLANDV